VKRIVVVGASAAGLAAVETLRREGYEGAITLIGDEPQAPYDRPPLSRQILTCEWEPDSLTLRSPRELGELDLDLRLGVTATALDLAARTVYLTEGGRVSYDGLVVATGVRPRTLPGEPAHQLRTVEDALRLRERLRPGTHLVVVGAGFLGTEVAAAARGLGCEVTVLEPGPVPLGAQIGAEAGGVLSRVHRDHGVRLRTGVRARGVTRRGVRLAGGELVEGDEVLVATGTLANTEWLEGSGLRLGDGLVCDRYSCAAPGVYGAGDVARWHNPLFATSMRLEYRTNAVEQGMVAAYNLLNPLRRRAFAPVPYFWSDQYDLTIQGYGYLSGEQSLEVVDGSLGDRRFVVQYRAGERLAGVLAVGMPPKPFHQWRQAISAGARWSEVIGAGPVTSGQRLRELVRGGPVG
jgi:NADPH-dependent 2,4-dienoyl-CoA reductase/sulfur reductase-like enzyme